MRQQHQNPALIQAQIRAKVKQALEMDKELDQKHFTSEDEDCLVVATGLAAIKELGFKLDNGEFLSDHECARLLWHLNRALGESYEFRNKAAKALFGELGGL